jgi:cbb3-type cytochrome oxidase subunit 3
MMARIPFGYALWCLAVLGLFVGSIFYAYSPFADGGRAPAGARIYGPTHK